MAVVTISRQYGSGGDEIARMVCDRLGYRYFDKDLMTTLCDPAKLSCDDISDLTEDTHRVQSRIERFFDDYPMDIAEIINRQLQAPGERRSPEVSFEQVESLMNTAYERGNVVVVGRGGQVILHDKPGVLHVRVEAPLEARIARVQQAEGLDAAVARERLEERDRAAVDYVQRFCHVDPADPHLYDLVISTRAVAPDVAADLIGRAAGALAATAGA